MFNRLDIDGNKSIDMDEMTELCLLNGIKMSKEKVAEMFSIVKKINDSVWLKKNHTFQPKKPYMMTIAEKLKLQLSM